MSSVSIQLNLVVWLHTESREKMSSQDEHCLEEERDKAVDQIEEFRSENEKLRRSLQDVIHKEGTFATVFYFSH